MKAENMLLAENQDAVTEMKKNDYPCPEFHAPPQLPSRWERILKMYLLINFTLFAPPVILFGIIFGDKAAEIVLKVVILFGLPFGIATTLFVIFLAKEQVRKAMHIRIISSDSTEPQEKFLMELIEKLSVKAGLPVCPEIGIFESREVNAFATGVNSRNAMLAFSSELLETMPPDSISAVAAHEIGHIRNGDMFTTNILSGVSRGVTLGIDFLANLIALCLRDKHNQEPIRLFVPTITGQIFAVFGVLVVLGFSRHREFRADHFAATMTSPEEMINVLQILKQDEFAGSLTEASSPMATLMITAPESFADFLSTHPTIKQRIKNLKNMEKEKKKMLPLQ